MADEDNGAVTILRDESGRFLNGGYKRGPSKFRESMVQVYERVFNQFQTDPEYQRVSLLQFGKDNPTAFYALAARLMRPPEEKGPDLTLQWKEDRTYETIDKANEGTRLP